MLSTENPPPDLCEISKLKSVSSDERTSGFNQQHLFEVDLFNSGLYDNNPLPKFSIRDYVFNTRGKDIKNNWPFSHKSLQLCVKHGVKDVLPPFQSLDSVRNQSILTDSDVKLSDHSVVVVNTEKLKLSDKSEEDTEFPSTTRSQSCSDINSLLPITSPCLEPPEKPEFAGRANKVDSSPVKKCRLIVKLTNISEPKSNEESAAVVSESMASKVCPVCKTFSSSSNTTLNAHIDQCLSVESSVKWTPNSKVVKHRIKPRKTRLMVDIYETALPCTLEDLDKRNGTNWCSNRGPPPDQDLEERSEEEEKKMYHSVNVEDNNQDGAVYIDSNGTKLRILSKLSNPPSNSNADDDPGPSKFVKRGDVGRKVLLSKKSKIFVQKHKPQKPSLDGQGSCSPLSDHLFDCLPHGSISYYNGLEAENGQQKLLHSEGCKEDDTAQHLVVSDQMKPDDFGMIKQWVGSKRTGIKKKINVERGNQHTDRSTKNLRVKSVSSLGDSFSKGSAASTSPISSDENPCVPPESHKRKDTLCSSHDGFIGASSLRKRPPFPLSTSQHSSDKKNDLMFSKFKPGKDLPSAHKRHMDPLNGTENHVSSRSDKKTGMCSNPNFLQHHRISSEGKKFASPRKSSSGHTILAGGKKLSSLRTALLSCRHTSVAEPKRNFGRKLLNCKKTRLHCSSQSDEEEFVVSRSAVRRQNSMVDTMGGSATQLEKDSDKSLMNRTRVLKLQQKSLKSSPESDSLSGGENVDSFTGDDDPNGVEEEEVEMLDELVREPVYGMTDGEAFESFSKSLDSAFPGLADSSNIECGSHYYSGSCPDELVLNGDQDNVVAEMDTDEVQGNYFVDVDPIPIPGPPGSFLPSPGRMGSEELQGHSSLTTCRLQSSEEGHEVVDMDSSDSPISAMSVVSNSVTGRGASMSITNLCAPSQIDVSVDHRTAPAFESCSPFEQAACGDRELNLLESRPALVSPASTHEVRNVQLCCCARKDGSLQGNHDQDQSQVIRRRTMTSPVVSTNDPKNEIHCLYMGSGTLPVPPESAASLQMGYPLGSCETKFQTSCGDCPSPSPSTPNPVLRLMGKNLMVVNKDESSSPRAMPMPVQSSTVMNHSSPRTSACNNQTERSSFHHSLPRGPSTFDHLSSSHGFKIPANYRPSQLSTHPSTPVFPPSMNFVNTSVDSRCHGFASGFNLVADQLGSKTRLEPRPAAESSPSCVHRLKTINSFNGTHKEIIVIDESEAGLGVKTSMEGGGGANPFYSYQTRVYPHFNGPPNGNNLGKWNCIPQGSTALHSNSSTPTGVHLRSPSLYISPGFS